MTVLLLIVAAQLTGGTTADVGTAGSVWDFAIFEPVDRNTYIVGAGDVLQMVLEGGTSEAMLVSGLSSVVLCKVSGDGMIQLSGVGQLDVAGLTIVQAEQELQRLVFRYYPGTVIGLGLVEPRTVKVWLRGMVERPGQYTLYAINRVSDLVSDAGGLSSYSSRTGWMVKADGDSVEVNLHFNRDTGQPIADPFLDGGAVVSFGLVSDPVYIVRPGIRNYTDQYTVPEVETWEHIRNETLEELMYRIGGITGNVDLARSYLVSSGEYLPVWSRGNGFPDHPVNPGDTLRLVVQGNDVYVAGAVHQRGIISYSPGMPVRSYVERAGGTVYNGSIRGTTLTRDGREIARGDEALDFEVLPGDVIEVPYGWIARHSQEIGILSTVVGITSTIIYLTR